MTDPTHALGFGQLPLPEPERLFRRHFGGDVPACAVIASELARLVNCRLATRRHMNDTAIGEPTRHSDVTERSMRFQVAEVTLDVFPAVAGGDG